jgi:hypothetical protein
MYLDKSLEIVELQGFFFSFKRLKMDIRGQTEVSET